MNLGAWPEGVPFDPASGIASLELEAIITGPGADWPAVILATDQAGRRSGWAARAAIEIAGAWAETGRHVILADLCFDEPELHDHLGVANAEGLADILLYGASLQTEVDANAERGFDFLPPGAFVPDAPALYGDSGWGQLIAGLRSSGGVLLAYTPIEAAGAASIIERVGQVILLAADLEAAANSESALSPASVQLVLRPPRPLPATSPEQAALEDDDDEPGIARRPPPEDETEQEPPPPPAGARRTSDEEFERIRVPKEEAREALIADLRARQREARMVPPPGREQPVQSRDRERAAERLARAERARHQRAETAATGDAANAARAADDAARSRKGEVAGAAGATGTGEAVGAARPPAGQRPRFGRHAPEPGGRPTEPDFVAARPRVRRRVRRSIVVITLIVVAIVSALAGAWRLWSVWAQRDVPVGPAAAEVEAPAPALEPPEPLRFSVAIEAHPDLPTAEARADALAEDEPRYGFYVTPILVDGTLFYRLMAGPVADSAAAAEMMGELVEAGHKTAASEWDIRETPITFLLGEFAAEQEASERVEELSVLAIPAYVVHLPATDGSMRYRVYGGAFTGPTEARVMGELLQSAGQPDSLVERMGRSRR